MINLEGLSRTERRELRSFFSWAYWVVGGLCFYWATVVFCAVMRPEQELDLPLLGKCSNGEAIIFTVTFLWPVLLIAHLLVHGHQSVAVRGSFSAQFPGVMADKDIPRSLRWLRVVLFIIMVLWPTVVHVTLTWRAFTQMWIVLKDGSSVYVRKDAPIVKNSSGEDEFNYERYQGWALLKPLSFPKEDGKEFKEQWRWLHWRDEHPSGEEKKVEVKFVGAGEKPMEMKIDYQSGKPVTVTLASVETQSAAEKKPAEKKEVKHLERVRPKHWPTAVPFGQPWEIFLSTLGMGISACWLLLRAWRNRKL